MALMHATKGSELYMAYGKKFGRDKNHTSYYHNNIFVKCIYGEFCTIPTINKNTLNRITK